MSWTAGPPHPTTTCQLSARRAADARGEHAQPVVDGRAARRRQSRAKLFPPYPPLGDRITRNGPNLVTGGLATGRRRLPRVESSVLDSRASSPYHDLPAQCAESRRCSRRTRPARGRWEGGPAPPVPCKVVQHTAWPLAAAGRSRPRRSAARASSRTTHASLCKQWHTRCSTLCPARPGARVRIVSARTRRPSRWHGLAATAAHRNPDFSDTPAADDVK